MISAIVAVNEDWGIGYQGQLLERIPADMKYFKETTMNHIVLMGRKTWDSLSHKPLPNRDNIVISSSLPKEADFYCENYYLQITSFDDDKINQLKHFNNDIFIIGGGEIYKQLLPYCDRVYITKIYKKHENVDTYFPNLDETNEWVASPISEIKEYNGIPYQFLKYERIS